VVGGLGVLGTAFAVWCNLTCLELGYLLGLLILDSIRKQAKPGTRWCLMKWDIPPIEPWNFDGSEPPGRPDPQVLRNSFSHSD
jgi:hypothetical protein